MLELRRAGCHNINFVSPSHMVAQILEALDIAAGQGLRLPLVYTTAGYDSPEALALRAGVIDIAMPDMKYGDPEVARRYSHIREDVHWNRAAIRQMQRQVGDLMVGDEAAASVGTWGRPPEVARRRGRRSYDDADACRTGFRRRGRSRLARPQDAFASAWRCGR